MIIFISGSINSGKSTVAKIIHEQISDSALVEVDKLREFIGWMPIERAVPINLQNAASVIKNFSRIGIHSIVPYPLSQRNYDYLVSELEEVKEKIFVFVLNPEMEKALTDRGGRKLTDSEKDRISYHYKIGINNPGFGIIIDNTDQAPEKTASIIMDFIK